MTITIDPILGAIIIGSIILFAVVTVMDRMDSSGEGGIDAIFSVLLYLILWALPTLVALLVWAIWWRVP